MKHKILKYLRLLFFFIVFICLHKSKKKQSLQMIQIIWFDFNFPIIASAVGEGL